MKPTLFILDGPDAAGKTTLAQRIAEISLPGHEVVYRHLTYIKDDAAMWQANMNALDEARACLASGKSFVLDRGWLSENVYSGVYRGGSGMPYDVRSLDRIIQAMCGVYILCAPTPESAVARHAKTASERPEMYAPDGRIESVARRFYDAWFGNITGTARRDHDWLDQITFQHGGFSARPDAMRYDIDGDGHHMDNVIMSARRLADILRGSVPSELAENYSNNLAGHVGRATTLFVLPPDMSIHGSRPTREFGGFNRLVSMTLHRLGFDESKGLWAHLRVSQSDDVLSFLSDRHLVPPKVVAFGERAARQLEFAGITKYKFVSHVGYADIMQAPQQKFALSLADALS